MLQARLQAGYRVKFIDIFNCCQPRVTPVSLEPRGKLTALGYLQLFAFPFQLSRIVVLGKDPHRHHDKSFNTSSYRELQGKVSCGASTRV